MTNWFGLNLIFLKILSIGIVLKIVQMKNPQHSVSESSESEDFDQVLPSAKGAEEKFPSDNEDTYI